MMRKYFAYCAIVALLGTVTGFNRMAAGGAPVTSSTSTAPHPAVEAGSAFLDLLVKGDYGQAVGEFDATMKGALPEAKLREAWESVNKQAGAFQKQVRTRVVEQKPYTTVFVTCQFEKALLDVQVVFDGQRKVTGLFFKPAT